MKTSELSGARLDWAVAKAEGYPDEDILVDCENYSADWRWGGSIIEREKIGVWWATHYVDDNGKEYGNHWYAENVEGIVRDGSTPLEAAMRCYVAIKLGNEVEIPEEMTND